MEKAGNRRTRMTKQLLKQSLLELLEQKKINAITVKEICERADVNRSTFYAYYSSPYDLFDSMKQDIIAESRALLVCELRLTPEQRMRFLLERHLRYLSEHLREFQAYSSDTGEDFSLPLQVMADMMGPYLDYLRGKYPAAAGENESLRTFCIYGGIGIIKRWVSRSMIESIDTIAQRVLRHIEAAYRGQW